MDVYSIIVRKCLFPLYLKKNRSRLQEYLDYYEKTQYFSSGSIEELQWKGLQKIIKHAYSHTRFYHQRFKDLGLDPDEVNTYRDFIQIPVLTKSDIQNNLKDIVSHSLSTSDLIADRTGGSTGTPLSFYYDKQRQELREAFRIRSNRWSSWDIGEKTAIIWGESRNLSDDFKSKIKNNVLREGIHLDAYSLTEKKMVQFASRLRAYEPRTIIAYASALSLFAKYLSESGITNLHPQGIITSAEALSNDNKQLIERVFNCKVFERYGCRELGPIAGECEIHNGLHINAESVFVEILAPETGRPVKDGDVGEIVVTDILNYAMPFIRYKIGDMGRLLKRKCSCGRGLPLMGPIEGRTTDYIKTPEGRIIAGPMAIPLLCDIQGIMQAQVIQEDINKITIKIRNNEKFNADSRNELIKRSREVFGQSFVLSIKYVDSIPCEPSGKFRFVISRINNKEK
ncbi:MAG: hypothetical protein VST71_05400 [Nitrospirota bacterium]|nr:hypothetical protein [Nitrospirota bacterium]